MKINARNYFAFCLVARNPQFLQNFDKIKKNVEIF